MINLQKQVCIGKRELGLLTTAGEWRRNGFKDEGCIVELGIVPTISEESLDCACLTHNRGGGVDQAKNDNAYSDSDVLLPNGEHSNGSES